MICAAALHAVSACIHSARNLWPDMLESRFAQTLFAGCCKEAERWEVL